MQLGHPPLDVRVRIRSGYRADLEQFWEWCSPKGIDPMAAAPRKLRRYGSFLREADYSDATIRRRITALRGFFQALGRSVAEITLDSGGSDGDLEA